MRTHLARHGFRAAPTRWSGDERVEVKTGIIQRRSRQRAGFAQPCSSTSPNHRRPSTSRLSRLKAPNSSTLAAYVNRRWTSTHSTEITADQLEKYEAYQKELDVLHVKYPEFAPRTLVKHVSFPFGQILLVTTLFILGRRMTKGSPNNHRQEATTGDPLRGSPAPRP